MATLLSEAFPNLTPEQIEEIGNCAKELVIANIGASPQADSSRQVETANGTMTIRASPSMDGERVELVASY
ncbi:MAG: hypothetical protein RLZZ127_176 [Planctomycetota bacterium]|jgi:hypothetical protein